MYSNRAAALTKLLAYRTQDANTFQIPVCFKYPCSQDMIMVEQGVPASESLLHALHEQIVAAFWMPQKSSEARYPDALRDLDECLKLAGNADSSL